MRGHRGEKAGKRVRHKSVDFPDRRHKRPSHRTQRLQEAIFLLSNGDHSRAAPPLERAVKQSPAAGVRDPYVKGHRAAAGPAKEGTIQAGVREGAHDT